MNRTHTDHITIGRNLGLTLAVLDGIRQREQRREQRQRRLAPFVCAFRRLTRWPLSRRS
jgi:hypothetical protein